MLFGTEEVDCRRLEIDGPTDPLSRGDKDRDASERAVRSTPREGPRLLGGSIPGWNGSVTARGRDFGRPAIAH